jgi:hypothetical protein
VLTDLHDRMMTPDIYPNIAETYRRRIERLTEALSHPDDALEAADAIREVIDRIVVTPASSAAAIPSRCKASLAPSSTGSTAAENRATNQKPTPLHPNVGFGQWPGLSRPSTSLDRQRSQDAAARHKVGHDRVN